MKDFIYVDTDYIHSFISQVEGGLPTNINLESTEEVKEQNDLQKADSTESYIEGKFKLGEIEIPLLFKSPTGEISTGIKTVFSSSEKVSLSQLESGREIISKKLHDDALKRFEDYMEKNRQFKTNLEDVNQGDLIKVQSPFQIIDLNYMKKTFNPDKLIYFIHFEEEKEIKELNNKLKHLKKEAKAMLRQKVSKLENQYKTNKKENEENFNFLNAALDYILDILPSDSFLKAKGILLPLKKKFLRKSSKDLIFKYGAKMSNSEITIVGKITRKINDVNVKLPDFKGEHGYLEFGEIVNFILHTLGILQLDDYIVSPIAIYFE